MNIFILEKDYLLPKLSIIRTIERKKLLLNKNLHFHQVHVQFANCRIEQFKRMLINRGDILGASFYAQYKCMASNVILLYYLMLCVYLLNVEMHNIFRHFKYKADRKLIPEKEFMILDHSL